MNAYNITLEEIKTRCIEEGECWIWQGAVNADGYPLVTREHVTMLARRVVATLAGKPPAPGQPVICSCRDRLCLNPEHLALSTKKKVQRATAKTVDYKNPARLAKLSASSRSRASVKLSPEAAEEIRYSSDSSPILAKKYGVHPSLIRKIKRGELWRDHRACPFAGLGARA